MRYFLLLTACVTLLASSAVAQVTDDATHIVTINAQPIVAIAVGADVVILLAATTPGSNLEGTNTSTYDVTSNMPDNKVSGFISDAAGAYTSGVQLFATLAAPATGGVSAGELELLAGAGNAVDLVTGIPAVQESGLGISYRATAPGTTSPTFSEAREITYTITGN